MSLSLCKDKALSFIYLTFQIFPTTGWRQMYTFLAKSFTSRAGTWETSTFPVPQRCSGTSDFEPVCLVQVCIVWGAARAGLRHCSFRCHQYPFSFVQNVMTFGPVYLLFSRILCPILTSLINHPKLARIIDYRTRIISFLIDSPENLPFGSRLPSASFASVVQEPRRDDLHASRQQQNDPLSYLNSVKQISSEWLEVCLSHNNQTLIFDDFWLLCLHDSKLFGVI